MNVAENLNNSYEQISSVLQSCKRKLQELKEQRFDPAKEKTLKDAIIKETNDELRNSLTVFFDTYEELESELSEKDAACGRIDRLPVQESFDTYEQHEGEIETLRKIENILERQEFIHKIERLSDEDVINLYQKTSEKAERLRNSLIQKVSSGEFGAEEAERVLRTDVNVRLAALFEDGEYPLTDKKPLQQTLDRMVSSAKTKRTSQNPGKETRNRSEILHSSVCFLLRDLGDNNLSIKDWRNRGDIISDPENRQVDFFLEQSEKYSSEKNVGKNIENENDIMSTNDNQNKGEAK